MELPKPIPFYLKITLILIAILLPIIYVRYDYNTDLNSLPKDTKQTVLVNTKGYVYKIVSPPVETRIHAFIIINGDDTMYINLIDELSPEYSAFNNSHIFPSNPQYYVSAASPSIWVNMTTKYDTNYYLLLYTSHYAVNATFSINYVFNPYLGRNFLKLFTVLGIYLGLINYLPGKINKIRFKRYLKKVDEERNRESLNYHKDK